MSYVTFEIVGDEVIFGNQIIDISNDETMGGDCFASDFEPEYGADFIDIGLDD